MKTEESVEKVQTPTDMKAEKEALRKEKVTLFDFICLFNMLYVSFCSKC